MHIYTFAVSRANSNCATAQMRPSRTFTGTRETRPKSKRCIDR